MADAAVLRPDFGGNRPGRFVRAQALPPIGLQRSLPIKLRIFSALLQQSHIEHRMRQWRGSPKPRHRRRLPVPACNWPRIHQSSACLDMVAAPGRHVAAERCALHVRQCTGEGTPAAHVICRGGKRRLEWCCLHGLFPSGYCGKRFNLTDCEKDVGVL